MAFMQTKTCCCGCSLRTGTVILALFLLVPSAMILADAFTNSRNYTSASIFYLILLVGSAASAIYAVKMDERLFLLPFIAIVVGLFIIMAILSLGLLLFVFGMSSLINTMGNHILPTEITASVNGDKTSVSWGSKNSSFSDALGPFSIFILVICLIIIVTFLHFVKVVCSLFAEMEKSNTYQNSILFASPSSPPVIIPSPMSLN